MAIKLQILLMAAMENNVYKGSEKYKSGKIKVDEATIKDWNNYGWGEITYDNGFMASSNVAATNLAFKLGRNKLLDYYKKLGFGKKTNIGLPNEFSGQLNFKYKTELANASFGQGILTTPIQNVKALTAIANDGVLLKPYIISKVVDSETGKVVEKGKKETLGEVASKDTITKIKDLMEGVVSGDPYYATGTGYNVSGYNVIGKTGTAQIASSSGGYYDNEVIKSFAGIFPKDDPEIILYVSVSRYGGNLPAVVKSTIEDIGKYINVTPDEDKDKNAEYKLPSFINKDTAEVKKILATNKQEAVVIGTGDKVINQYPNKNAVLNYGSKVFLLTNSTDYKMPNLTGWSSGEVTNFGNLVGITFEFNGYGYVTSQSLKSGTNINASTKVKVNLKPKYKK